MKTLLAWVGAFAMSFAFFIGVYFLVHRCQRQASEMNAVEKPFRLHRFERMHDTGWVYYLDGSGRTQRMDCWVDYAWEPQRDEMVKLRWVWYDYRPVLESAHDR